MRHNQHNKHYNNYNIIAKQALFIAHKQYLGLQYRVRCNSTLEILTKIGLAPIGSTRDTLKLLFSQVV